MPSIRFASLSCDLEYPAAFAAVLISPTSRGASRRYSRSQSQTPCSIKPPHVRVYISEKNGKPYDFQSVSFVYKDQYTTGYKAATSNIPGDMIDAIGGVKVDEEREIFYHGYNGTVTVDGIL